MCGHFGLVSPFGSLSEFRAWPIPFLTAHCPMEWLRLNQHDGLSFRHPGERMSRHLVRLVLWLTRYPPSAVFCPLLPARCCFSADSCSPSSPARFRCWASRASPVGVSASKGEIGRIPSSCDSLDRPSGQQ